MKDTIKKCTTCLSCNKSFADWRCDKGVVHRIRKNDSACYKHSDLTINNTMLDV